MCYTLIFRERRNLWYNTSLIRIFVTYLGFSRVTWRFMYTFLFRTWPIHELILMGDIVLTVLSYKWQFILYMCKMIQLVHLFDNNLNAYLLYMLHVFLLYMLHTLHKCEMSQPCVSQVYISYLFPTCWSYTWHYPDTLMNYRIDIRPIPTYVNIYRKSEHIPNYVCVHSYFNLERDAKVYMFDT